jgi:hypothetical protein
MRTTFLILSLFLNAVYAQANNPYHSVTNVTLPTAIEKSILVGTYYKGDGLGYNLTLTLESEGHYSCTWRGCLGVYGTATGTWAVATNILYLSPTTATSMLKKKPLPPLDILVFEGRYIFVDPSCRDFFLKYGPDRISCFQKDEARTKRSKATSGSDPELGAEPEAPEL